MVVTLGRWLQVFVDHYGLVVAECGLLWVVMG